MSARPMLSHVRDHAPIILTPDKVKSSMVTAAATYSKPDAVWSIFDDLPPIKADVIISNPPYSAARSDGKRNPFYWQKVIPAAAAALDDGGIFVLLAPIIPTNVFKDFEVLESHTDEAVVFEGAYIAAIWVVLRKRLGHIGRPIFKAHERQFPNMTCRYADPLSAKDMEWVHSDSDRIHFNYFNGQLKHGPYNQGSTVIYGSDEDCDEFRQWMTTDEFVKFRDSVVGGGAFPTTKIRALLGMKK